MEQVYYEDTMEKNQELHRLNVEHLKASIDAKKAFTRRANTITEYFEGFSLILTSTFKLMDRLICNSNY